MEKKSTDFYSQENTHWPYLYLCVEFWIKYQKLFNPTDINTDQTKVIYSATSLVKQKEPQILIQTVLKNWLYFKWE